MTGAVQAQGSLLIWDRTLNAKRHSIMVCGLKSQHHGLSTIASLRLFAKIYVDEETPSPISLFMD